MNLDPHADNSHDPQEGPTMRQVRRARAEAYEAGRGRTAQEQRELEERLAKEYGLTLRPAHDGGAPDQARPRGTA
jgi:hypothetical protein